MNRRRRSRVAAFPYPVETPASATPTPTGIDESRSSARRKTPRSSGLIVIESVTPALDAGRYRVRRIVGDVCAVSADIHTDARNHLRGSVRYKGPGDAEWRSAPLAHDAETDRWSGAIVLDRVGGWTFTIDVWTDVFGSWRDDLEKRFDAGYDVSTDLRDGAQLVLRTARRIAFGEPRTTLRAHADALVDADVPMEERFERAIAPELRTLIDRHWIPDDLTTYGKEFEIVVDRKEACFAAWYEMYPRSQTSDPTHPGTFATAERELPRIAGLGFDVVCLPPPHPIGHSHRRGRGGALRAEPNDPGDPWSVGDETGGHCAVHPALGTLADFDRFVVTAQSLGLEVALDLALQCSPDHPWVSEHPEWFYRRADGSIRCLEEPPSRSPDIFPLNFHCADHDPLWLACRDIVRFWIARGVRMFRADTPDTKPSAFWEWLIAEIQDEFPDVIILAGTPTRSKRKQHLSKLGFSNASMSVDWGRDATEIERVLSEMFLARQPDDARAHLVVRAPDVRAEAPESEITAAFRTRMLLAATAFPLYGISSGFELLERGSGRSDSPDAPAPERYEIRARAWNVGRNLSAELARLNEIRHQHAALQRADNLAFHHSENPRVLCFSKRSPGAARNAGDLLIVITTDPKEPQETIIGVPLERFGIRPDEPYILHDLLTGASLAWRGGRNKIRIHPGVQPGFLFRIEPA